MQGGCLKCGGTDIRSRLSEIPGAGYEGATPTRIYVCADCGYSETYVVPAALAQLDTSTLWKRVPIRIVSNKPLPATGETTRLYPQDGETAGSFSPQPKRVFSYTCLSCGSRRIVHNVLVRLPSTRMPGIAAELPDSFLRQGGRPFTSGITGWLCGDCGALALFVIDPRKLYEAAR